MVIETNFCLSSFAHRKFTFLKRTDAERIFLSPVSCFGQDTEMEKWLTEAEKTKKGAQDIMIVRDYLKKVS